MTSLIKINGFNTSFYQDKLTYPGKEKLIQAIGDRYHVQPTHKPDSWREDIHTSIQYGQFSDSIEYFRLAGIPLDLVTLIDQKIQSVLETENIRHLGRFYIREMWYNAYTNGQYQHKHHHNSDMNNFFSGVYYLKFDAKQHTATRFFNPHFDIASDKINNHPLFVYSPTVRENDLFIFPSSVSHDVPAQMSDNLRITVSFNVSCMFYGSGQYV